LSRVCVTYGRVEQSPGDSEEDPCIDRERKSEAQADVEELDWVWALWQIRTLRAARGLGGIGYLSASKGEESAMLFSFRRTCDRGESSQKEKGSHELAGHGDEMISRLVGNPHKK
jgi:hypothetical protein